MAWVRKAPGLLPRAGLWTDEGGSYLYHLFGRHDHEHDQFATTFPTTIDGNRGRLHPGRRAKHRPGGPRGRHGPDQDRPDRLRRAGTGAAGNCLDVPDNIKLVAVADAFEDNARHAAEALKQRYGDKVDLPRRAGVLRLRRLPEGDPVRAWTWCCWSRRPVFGPVQYRAAVEAGKHVFMEKPCCVDAPGYRSLQETNKLAEQKGLKIAVGLNMRHTPSYQETVQRIHDGAVGPISFLRCYGNNAGVWVRPRKPGRPRWSTRCGTGTTSSGSAAT